jgi:DNA-binding transcriptional MerR regulator
MSRAPARPLSGFETMLSSKAGAGRESMTQTEAAGAPHVFHTITQLAEDLGVTPRAVRFYEQKGLITPSRAGTTRVYTRREHARMQLILRGKRLGFSLREIREFLDLYDADPGQHEQMRALVRAVRHRIDELEHQKAALLETLGELTEIERQALDVLEGRAPPKRRT